MGMLPQANAGCLCDKECEATDHYKFKPMTAIAQEISTYLEIRF